MTRPTVHRANLGEAVVRVIDFARWVRWRIRLMRDDLVFVGACLSLLIAAARGRVTELWLGDSHAAHLNDGLWPCPRLRRLAGGRFIWHLGPRLMFSIARDGFPYGVELMCRALGMIGRRDRLALCFALGEIDVRCHLAPRLVTATTAPTFPGIYVDRGRRLGMVVGAAAVIFVVPTPPSDDYEDVSGFPIRGALTERLHAFGLLRDGLATAVAAASDGPPSYVLDCTVSLARQDGSLRPDLTIDGCHVNDQGRIVVRNTLAQLVPGSYIGTSGALNL